MRGEGVAVGGERAGFLKIILCYIAAVIDGVSTADRFLW
jgi:hypothetical protein